MLGASAGNSTGDGRLPPGHQMISGRSSWLIDF